MVVRRLGEAQWRTAYNGLAISVPLGQLLQSPDDADDDDDVDDDGDDAYACRVTSQNDYGWGIPSDVLTLNNNDAFTAGKFTTTSGQYCINPVFLAFSVTNLCPIFVSIGGLQSYVQNARKIGLLEFREKKL